MSNLPQQESRTAQGTNTNSFFEGYYKITLPINGQQYDAVLTFFLKKTGNNKVAAEALAATFIVIAQNRGINPISLLDELKSFNNDDNFKAALLSFINSDRNPTSKLGFGIVPQSNPYVVRNIGR